MNPNPEQLKSQALRMRTQLIEQWHMLHIVAHGPELPGTVGEIAAARAKLAETEALIAHLEGTYLAEEMGQKPSKPLVGE